jgi:NADPH:quinone reductase-like Zn-dependent oxidoreductase
VYPQVAVRLSPQFRAATSIVPAPLALNPPEGKVLIRRVFAGVNASDINFTSGKYFGPDAASKLPFDVGFEAVGVVAGTFPATPPREIASRAGCWSEVLVPFRDSSGSHCSLHGS